MTLTVTTLIVVLIVAAVLYKIVMKIADALFSLITGILNTPAKGFKKFTTYAKNRKAIKLDRKLTKALWEQDKIARINAARNNPSYANAIKVRKIKNKIEKIELKNK